MTIRTKTLVHAALVMVAGAGLSGCVYDLGLGFASDGYYDDGYGCDPYGRYDAYYDCDYGQGFSNIGFGGGWYDNYYYPGYGIFLFDNVGRRYPMRDQYRRYWSEKRHNWYREHRGDRRQGGRYDGRPGRYNDGVTPGQTSWPDRRGPRPERVQDGDNDRRDRRREGRRPRAESWRAGDGRPAGAVSVPNADDQQRTGRNRDGQQGYGRGGPHVDSANAAPSARPPRAPQDVHVPRSAPPPPPVATPARPERVNPAPRQNSDDGGPIRDQ